jgi:hypothetical protein
MDAGLFGEPDSDEDDPDEDDPDDGAAGGHSVGRRGRESAGAVPDGGEGRLDRVRGAQVDPVLGREVVDREQDVDVVGDLRDGFAELGGVGRFEGSRGVQGVAAVFGVPDLGEGRRGRCRGCLGRMIADDCRYWRMRI